MELVRPPDDPAPPRRLRRASFLLGFAMGGFFDGILPHQILQWHHLLSGVQTGALESLSAQVAVDGVFHAITYVIAAAGLIELFRARSAVASSAPIRPRLGLSGSALASGTSSTRCSRTGSPAYTASRWTPRIPWSGTWRGL
jgi:hypothetical protein